MTTEVFREEIYMTPLHSPARE